MKILALALADDSQRFLKGYPPRGAWLFLQPNLEISRLAEFVAGTDELVYQDQRVQALEWNGTEDICLIHVGFGQENAGREIVGKLKQTRIPFLLFGPLVTAWANKTPSWATHRVQGNILNIWHEIKADTMAGKLKETYRSPCQPHYFPPHPQFGHQPEMNTRQQVMNFVLGCSCPEPLRQFCPEYLYYGENILFRAKEEIIGEVVSLPRKHIRLLDEDIAREPDYYYDLFRTLWNYRRHWTVTASDRLFNHPELIRFLAKAGTRIVILNETFLMDRLEKAQTDTRLVKMLYRRVKLLQTRRMLVGTKIALRLTPGHSFDFEKIASVLYRLDLDFIEMRFFAPSKNGTYRLVPVMYRPTLSRTDPAWVKNYFYAMESVLNRLARRPRRVGFYTTAKYLLPYSLAYRQNFLEGIPFP